MKLKEVFYLLGLKPKIRAYGHRIESVELAPGDSVDFAYWLHPASRPDRIDAAQVAALSEFLRPGDTAIDIGAQIGDTTVPMALAAGAQGCVFAFEPNPAAFAVLEANAGLNRERVHIVPYRYAAGDGPGKLVFRYSDPGLCNGGELRGLSRWRHAHAFEIEVETVDAERFLRERHPVEISKLRYLKVDSEGADLRVLRSMSGLVDEFRPFVRCEVYRHLSREEREELFRFFLDRGYALHRFVSPREYRGPRLGLEDVCHEEHYDLFAVPEDATP